MRKKRWGHLFVLFGFLSVLTAAEKEFDTGDAVRGSAPGNLFLESEKLLFSLRLPPGETLFTEKFMHPGLGSARIPPSCRVCRAGCMRLS